ncbi:MULTISPECIES: SUMF1/EgtB/PvdO family nonheme iron enzyme [unclassified Flavobacterium]|uniref:formylglycine-generating enzyme family protein n=1 Tax=unclassified Flavobacterium TaxID=196869 RepID=UPI001F129F80|nr:MULTISPECIES: SUMF1/EgtB/PvdO family nonheme iron enzyme [unclassified Flavobacterium]UMY66939.1 SUMF1/EgtB/PvdO family nonheme iron enzyme [Flavobacterium sp. HJ-32-4]
MKTNQLLSRLCLWFVLLASGAASANNLVISSTQVTGNQITFDISWDNSWYTNIAPANFDAVWVFVKYQDCNTRLWAHAGLSTTSSDHTAGSPLTVDAVSDGKGVFIHRLALGGGNIATTSVTLTMTIPAGTYNFKVFGIEMVNVPQGGFEVGDATSASSYNAVSITAAHENNGITAAALGGTSSNVPAAYPVGYNSFYIMKYEISQIQYVEFLNALTYDQQKTRTTYDPISAAGTTAMYSSRAFRNGIIVATPGNNNILPAVYACDYTTGVENNIDDAQNNAMNFMSWADLTAYLDWAALRPMTELEYEKACRGTMARLAGEYPWGSTTIALIHAQLGGLVNDFQPNENYNSPTNGACMYGVGNSGLGQYGPLRTGLLATNSSGRASSGAGFYGAMELGGNVWERVVNTGATGVTFTGNLGDGELAVNGEANQTSWPPITAIGAGFRGGSYNDPATSVRTSDRGSATSIGDQRFQSYGGRGVR